MKKMDFARYAVLGIFAVVGFVSCEKKENESEIVTTGHTVAQTDEVVPVSSLTRRASGTYTVQSRYKTNYVHDAPHRHDIATGFVSWINCIARAHGTPLLTVDEVFSRCEVTHPSQIIRLPKLRDKFYPVELKAFAYDGDKSAETNFEDYLMGHKFNGGRPCSVLIKNNYNGQWKKVLVTVLTYQNGYIYYQDSKASTLGSMDFDTFTARAKQASDWGDRINVLRI